MITDWLAYAIERRLRRKLSFSAKPKRQNSLASLAKAWHIDKDKLNAAILQIAKEKEEGVISNEQNSSPS